MCSFFLNNDPILIQQLAKCLQLKALYVDYDVIELFATEVGEKRSELTVCFCFVFIVRKSSCSIIDSHCCFTNDTQGSETKQIPSLGDNKLRVSSRQSMARTCKARPCFASPTVDRRSSTAHHYYVAKSANSDPCVYNRNNKKNYGHACEAIPGQISGHLVTRRSHNMCNS